MSVLVFVTSLVDILCLQVFLNKDAPKYPFFVVRKCGDFAHWKRNLACSAEQRSNITLTKFCFHFLLCNCGQSGTT